MPGVAWWLVTDNDFHPDQSPRRAVVLGGGGVAGIAWETGLVTGLMKHGIDLRLADVVVGTSAGSVVGAGLLANTLDAIYDGLSADTGAPAPQEAGDRDLSRTMKVIMAGFASTEGEDAARRTIGELALEDYQRSDDKASLDRMRPLLPGSDWPAGDLRITAVNAETGRFTVFSSDTTDDLVSAVAASCAVPGVFKPVTIDGHPYMDGGMRSATNADVASDCDAILVIACSVEAPMSGLGPTLPGTIETLRGSIDVFVIQADDESIAAFGTNPLLPSTSHASAEAGRRQADLVADAVREFWG